MSKSIQPGAMWLCQFQLNESEDLYALRILRRLTGPSLLFSQRYKSEQLANR